MNTHTLCSQQPLQGQKWQTIANGKQAERQAMLSRHPEWRLQKPVPPSIMDVSRIHVEELTPRELEIVSHDATSLLDHIRARRYTSVEVIKAYCHAATIAQELNNCLSEIFFDEGIQRAKELDEHMDRTGKPIGPLHGLPVSVKDHIMIKGKDTSTGYIAWCNKTIAEKDAVVVDILRQAGAVLYVKTNNPQTLLSLETDNNIFGRTTNPFNRALTPGGSSGGESALISSHGSPLGLGTDIGGSIRIPAVHTGLYGFKASVARMPHAGLRGSHDGMDAIVGALGPITRSARDLSLFCRVMSLYEPWLVEPPLLEIPWRQEVVDGQGIPQKLCFAILWNDGVVKPHPPILDALAKLNDRLKMAGHNVIEWIPFQHKHAWDLITKLYFLDGGQEYRDVLAESGEPPVPQTEWIMKFVPNGGKSYSVPDIFRLNLEREAFRVGLANHWNETKSRTGTGRPVDAIICPVAPSLAPAHNATKWWGYTSYWNLADFPAAVFPVGRFAEDELVPTSPTHSPTVSQCNGVNGHDNTEEFVRGQWDPKLYHNMPVGLQLVGRRLNEEKVLGILNVVEAVMHGL